MTKDLAINKKYSLEKPAEVVAMAVILKDYVVKQKLYAKIKDRNYAMVEGWQFAGFLSGLNAIVEEVKDLSTDKEMKWSATSKLYDASGKVVGIGFAICSSKEVSKKGFDEYAILSMAQTRSLGKAYRNKIGWIMKLASFESTPSEEMRKVGDPIVSPESAPNVATGPIEANAELKKGQVIGPDGRPTYICSKCDDPIDEQVANYSMKVYHKHLCRDDQPKKK
jgi:hypothetical protein